MTISNEAILAAGKAFYGDVWSELEDGSKDLAIDQLRSMLEAAVPIIRAEALREAAESMREERHSWCLDDSGRYWIKRTLDELAERGRQ